MACFTTSCQTTSKCERPFDVHGERPGRARGRRPQVSDHRERAHAAANARPRRRIHSPAKAAHGALSQHTASHNNAFLVFCTTALHLSHSLHDTHAHALLSRSATPTSHGPRLPAQERAGLVEFRSSTALLRGCSTLAGDGPERRGGCYPESQTSLLLALYCHVSSSQAVSAYL